MKDGYLVHRKTQDNLPHILQEVERHHCVLDQCRNIDLGKYTFTCGRGLDRSHPFDKEFPTSKFQRSTYFKKIVNTFLKSCLGS